MWRRRAASWCGRPWWAVPEGRRPSAVPHRAGLRLEIRHQSTVAPATNLVDLIPNRPSRIRRTTGAAVVEPWPACSTIATTTYLGLPAGAIAANHEYGCFGRTSAVPVLPATGYWERGNPVKANSA